jgi:cytochrome c biogenesis protein CcdA
VNAAPTWYARIVGGVLLVQGVVTGLFLLVDPLDDAVPAVLDTTRMVPQHSALHVATGLLALALLRWGSARALWWFAAGFGCFYTALAVGGLVTGHHLGLELQPFDHPFHLVVGLTGLLAAGAGSVDRRSRSAGSTPAADHRPVS